MKFKDLKDLENYANSTKGSESYNQSEILKEFLEKEKKKTESRKNPFVFFYEDVISNSIGFNFKTAIGETSFDNASDDALACLEICCDFNNLPVYSISGWLQNALKFTDHIVLHYIQEVLKAKPIIIYGEEKSRYIQIKRIKGDISDAGEKLIYLYDLRSKQLEHRTRVYPDGRQEIIPPLRNRIRKEIIKSFPVVLKLFLRNYKGCYTHLHL